MSRHRVVKASRGPLGRPEAGVARGDRSVVVEALECRRFLCAAIQSVIPCVAPLISGTDPVASPAPVPIIALNGSATIVRLPEPIVGSEFAMQLTDDINGQTGSIFLTNARNVNRDFYTRFRFQMPRSTGADGFAFVIQSNSPNALGAGGGDLGYKGIANSLAVKFDLYNPLDPGSRSDRTGIYIGGEAVTDDGTDIGFEIDNGHVFEATLTYDADGADVDGDGIPDAGTDSDALTIKIVDLTDTGVTPYIQSFSLTHNGVKFDIDTLLGSDEAFLGFTGATGGLHAEQNILDWTINGCGLGPPSPPPHYIDAVYVRAASWAGPDADPANRTFTELLEAKGLGDDVYGYRVDNVTTTLPWINMNQIVLHFSVPIFGTVISSGAAVVLDGQQSDYAVTTVEQLDPQAIVLTLNRALGRQPLGAAHLTLGDRVRMTVPIYPAGTTYDLALNVLQGDADRAANTRVTTSDVNFVKARLNRTSSEAAPPGAAYSVFADLNGDGRIHTADVNAIKARLNDILPAVAPVVAALFSDSRIADTVLA